MSAGLGIVILLGIAVTVALGILKKLEVDVEGKFQHGGYETEFDFEWELEKQKQKRKRAEESDNTKRDSRDTEIMQRGPEEDIPQMERQPLPAVPSYYYPFYPAVGVPPYYPYFYH